MYDLTLQVAEERMQRSLEWNLAHQYGSSALQRVACPTACARCVHWRLKDHSCAHQPERIMWRAAPEARIHETVPSDGPRIVQCAFGNLPAQTPRRQSQRTLPATTAPREPPALHRPARIAQPDKPRRAASNPTSLHTGACGCGRWTVRGRQAQDQYRVRLPQPTRIFQIR